MAGAAVQFSGSPARIVFAVLAVVTLLGIGVAILSSETVPRRPGARRALRPELSIPRPAAREFAAAVPVQIGAWMFVGLFMGLMPTIVRELFHIDNGLTIGATVCVEPGSAAVVGLLAGRASPRGTVRLGGAAMIVGAVLVMIGVSTTTLSLVVVGGAIGGVGFGASYSGSLRTISPLAEPDQRAGLFAALFTVAYLAFGVPVIIAGQLIPRAGLLSTVMGYCVVTVLVAAAGLIAQLVIGRRGSAKASEASIKENAAFVPGWPGCLPPRSDPGGAVGD
jgi:MFS family permease